MRTIECHIVKENWFYSFSDEKNKHTMLILQPHDKKHTKNSAYELIKKSGVWCKFLKERFNHILDASNFHCEKVLPPKTYPKFTNETPFAFEKTVNPKIIAHRWNGSEWEYKLENIGHAGQYYSEKSLTQINLL